VKKRVGKDDDSVRQKNKKASKDEPQKKVYPKKKYAKLMHSIDDALCVIARIANKIENGKIDIQEARAIGYLANIYIEGKKTEYEKKMELIDELLLARGLIKK
jgi:hypothetical protein